MKREGNKPGTSVHRKTHREVPELSLTPPPLKQLALSICEPSKQQEQLQHFISTFPNNEYELPHPRPHPLLRRKGWECKWEERKWREEETATYSLTTLCKRAIGEHSKRIQSHRVRVEVGLLSQQNDETSTGLNQHRIPLRKRKVLCMRSSAANVMKYTWETGRTLKKQISEHEQAVKRCDHKMGLLYKWWTRATPSTGRKPVWRPPRTQATGRVQEAIRIQRLQNTMNLDCGMILSNTRTPTPKLCWQQQFFLPSIRHGHAFTCLQSPLIFIILFSPIIPEYTSDKGSLAETLSIVLFYIYPSSWCDWMMYILQ